MDEPTAALSPVEVERLFRIAETGRADGAAILFISHRLDKVFALCQRVTILRDGKLVLSQKLEGLTADDLIRGMVGRDLLLREHRAHPRAPPSSRLIVSPMRACSRTSRLRSVPERWSHSPGLVGAGRSEVARAILGMDRYDAGSVRIGGETLRRGSPLAAMTAGIGFVPEDRHRQHGLVMDFSTEDNIALASLARLKRHGLLFAADERKFSLDWAKHLQVKYGRMSNAVSSLSGGNQQKVVFAKWLSREPRLLIVDEPTRGIDVGTKAEKVSTACCPRTGARRGRADDLIRAPRGAVGCRPDYRDARGSPGRRAHSRQGIEEERIIAAATGAARTTTSRRATTHEHDSTEKPRRASRRRARAAWLTSCSVPVRSGSSACWCCSS